MRKNRTMKLAALLLVLTLITSCFVGGTFAKYTSSATGTDTVTTAAWSFKVGEGEAAKDIVTEDEFVFDLFAADAVVAPGKSGTVQLKLKNDSAVPATYTLTIDDAQRPFTVTIAEGENTGTIIAGGNATVDVTWAWDFGANVDDTDYAGDSYTVTATLTAVQAQG